MKIIVALQVIYDSRIHGYTTMEIYFNIDDIACVQEYSNTDYMYDTCKVWLEGQDSCFVIKGSAREFIQKMKDAKVEV